MAKGIKFDFLSFFTREAKNLVKQYQHLMDRGVGVSLDNAPENKPSTIKKKGFSKWMVDTGELKNRGFKYLAKKDEFSVFGNSTPHSKGGTTYNKLFEIHNTAKGRYSGVFGKLPVGSKFVDRFEKEAIGQIKKHVLKVTPKVVKI